MLLASAGASLATAPASAASAAGALSLAALSLAALSLAAVLLAGLDALLAALLSLAPSLAARPVGASASCVRAYHLHHVDISGVRCPAYIFCS